MASVTKKLKVRRKLKKASSGKTRKNRNKVHGSTALDLPLNMPNAQERALKAATKRG